MHTPSEIDAESVRAIITRASFVALVAHVDEYDDGVPFDDAANDAVAARNDDMPSPRHAHSIPDPVSNPSIIAPLHAGEFDIEHHDDD
jgi:hypothetical protein